MSKIKVIQCGAEYRIYTEELTVHDDLPPRAYNICYDPRRGYWLEGTDVTVPGTRFYGNLDHRISKVISAYNARGDRNIGVLLSGKPGSGKSLWTKHLIKTAIESEKMPVILVKKNIGNGLADYLASIKTRCVLVFDEFDKMFPKHDDNGCSDEPSCGGDGSTASKDPQNALLSLFDGVSDESHKIIVCTCNDIKKCSEFIINRPGRMFYHFRFSTPPREDALRYFTDNVKSEYADKIEQMVNIAGAMHLSYDSMEALCYEVNNGEDIKEALDDLNIVSGFGMQTYLVEAVFKDGSTARETISFSQGDHDVECWFYRKHPDNGNRMQIRIKFAVQDMKFDMESGKFYVTKPDTTLSYHGDKELGKDSDCTIVVKLILEPFENSYSSSSIFSMFGEMSQM